MAVAEKVYAATGGVAYAGSSPAGHLGGHLTSTGVVCPLGWSVLTVICPQRPVAPGIKLQVE